MWRRSRYATQCMFARLTHDYEDWIEYFVLFLSVLQRKHLSLARTFQPYKKKKWVRDMNARKHQRTNEQQIYSFCLFFPLGFFFGVLKCVLKYSIQSTNQSCMQYGIIVYPSGLSFHICICLTVDGISLSKLRFLT